MVDLNFCTQGGVRQGFCFQGEIWNPKPFADKFEIQHDELENYNGIPENNLPDPYLCSLQILVSEQDGKSLRKIYSPLVEGIDPTFQFINIQEVNANELWGNSQNRKSTQKSSKLSKTKIICPSINIGLFLRENSGFLSADKLQEYFFYSPWRLHYSVSCPNRSHPTTQMTQDFYQNFRDLPLWTVRPVHYGNEHLRFYIFVKNFTAMKTFYQIILDAKPTFSRQNFCYFMSYSQSGLDVQLALKFSDDVWPEQTHTSQLKFRIKDIYPLSQILYEPIVPSGKPNTWATLDPDGNTVILEQTHPVRAYFSVEDFDQNDLSSEISSSGYNSVTNDSYEESSRDLDDFNELLAPEDYEMII